MQKENESLRVLTMTASLFLVISVVLVSIIAANQLKERKYIGMDIEGNRIVSVSGTGEVFAVPDIATITFSVINESETAEEAIRESAEKMNQAINFLKEQGIENSDLKTTNLGVYPRYEYRSAGEMFPPSGERELVAYQANQSLEVKIRNLDEVGSIIEGTINVGANQVSNLFFTVEDEEELKNKAREMAIAEANKKASELENQLGIKLKRIVSYNETGQPYLMRDFAVGAETMAMDSDTPVIEPGENRIEVGVNIGYQIEY